MFRAFTVVILLLSVLYAGWVNTYGHDGCDVFEDAIALSDGGFLAVGYTNSFGGTYYDFWAVKISSEGDVIWEDTYGGEYNDKCFAVCDVGDGYILTGLTNSFGAGTPGYSNIYIIKIDDGGEIIWENYFESDLDDCAYDIIPYGDECIIAGYTWLDFSTMDEGILVFLSPSDGTIDSARTTSGINSDGFCGNTSTDYGYAAVGYTKSFGTGTPSFSNVYLEKSTGEEFSLGGSNTDEGSSIISDGSGSCIIAGKTSSFGAGNTDILLLKVNSSGEILWQSAFGGTGYDYANDVIAMEDGFISIGNTNSFGAGYDDLFIVKTDFSGDSLWTKTYGGMQNDNGNAIVPCDDGGFLLVGATMSFGEGDFDGYLLRVNAQCDTAADGIKMLEKPQKIDVKIFPNPFNSSCSIIVDVPENFPDGEKPQMEIYDVVGRTVKKFQLHGGKNRIIWNANGERNGIYFACVNWNGEMYVRRIVLIK
ncbi:T9SS type A sorting domain-containing protein [bacterium]|nr:T9SS type A sorting domain-containing protein [bacterium]